ncbi:MAG TPA: hypothetical protein VHF69_11880 [Candidatus Synoicihabitans sp.]|nr:hypothetical protein [Candidatus Synoicihabitans sp.]
MLPQLLSSSCPIRVRLWLVLTALAGIELLLGLAYVTTMLLGEIDPHPLVDLDREANLPTWFSSLQLAAIAALLAFYGLKAFALMGVAVPITLLGAGLFLLLSADEATQLHERTTRSLRDVTWLPRVRNDRGIWVFVYLAALVPLALLAGWAARILWLRANRLWLLIAVSGCVLYGLSAAGIELFADQYLRARVELEHAYRASVLAEELLEMFGASLIFVGLAGAIFDSPPPRTRVSVWPAGESETPVVALTSTAVTKRD